MIIKRHSWLIPLIVLAVLLTANSYRWTDTLASKTCDDYVLKWSQDTWTGHYWVSVFTITEGTWKCPANQDNKPAVYRDTEVFTWCWRVAVGAASLWLIIALILISRRKEAD